MATKLTPALVAAATGPADGKAYNLIGDSEVIGLGLRTTQAGAKAWTFSYRTHSGISRRLTIGNVGDWPLKLARDEATPAAPHSSTPATIRWATATNCGWLRPSPISSPAGAPTPPRRSGSAAGRR